jgi:hypothetical protein
MPPIPQKRRKEFDTMRHKHVRMIIKPDGSCTVDAINFTDATCTHATQQIVAALGGSVTNDRLKPETQRLPPQANRQTEASR